jgi:hypothetical protein
MSQEQTPFLNFIKEEELEQQKNAEEKELWGISGRQT